MDRKLAARVRRVARLKAKLLDRMNDLGPDGMEVMLRTGMSVELWDHMLEWAASETTDEEKEWLRRVIEAERDMALKSRGN